MLIDATHPEETRVVVIRGNRVEEFDYESASRKQLRGSIYLAKVARIEPSLQAAFVNYGGNRHGFLAFSEIHPDYYQIPVADREAVLREEAAERTARMRQEDADLDGDGGRSRRGGSRRREEGQRGERQRNGNRETRDEARDADDQDLPEVVGGDDTEDRTDFQRESLRHEAQGERDGYHPSHDEKQDVQNNDQPDETNQPGVMPLQAILPSVLYGEFADAVARGEEARDEIPAHDDDIASDDAAPTQEEGADSASPITMTAGGGDTEFPEAVAARQAGEAHSDDEPTGSNVETAPSGDSTEPAAAPIEIVGSEDALEELPQRTKRRWRQYKIQEVIKRNQIVLIQVVKEERGTKGAALTTYLSLAGRYTVLMPNTASGGGISRKITNPADRKRLKEIANELEVPEGMGLIIRTAGASRTKAEIKRDFEYLLRLWENVRDLTLRSTAPALVYEEGDLIRRSIRDLYNKDIDEVLVAGDDAYREAKDFMRMLMPSHAKNVQLYKDPEPIFTRYEVERQLNQMFSPVVTLKSGGYIVLNQTEALVAIDVNSGRSTREYSIEETALKTNAEAAEEIARQVRLRDLAGLIVIDFIDMDERRNNRTVERKLKEALRHDRARIQVGHISHFGLLEMSRQRLRQGVVEVSTVQCPMCQGVGTIRSTESVALMILRAIEDHLRTQGASNLNASCSINAALYILNHKRSYLRDIETRYGVIVTVNADAKMHGAHFAFERSTEPLPVAPRPVEEPKAVHMDWAHHGETDESGETPSHSGSAEPSNGSSDDRQRSRRRRRRRGRGRGEGRGEELLENGTVQMRSPDEFDADETDDEGDESYVNGAAVEAADEEDDETVAPAAGLRGDGSDGSSSDRGRRNRRRGRRAGRRRRGSDWNGDIAQPSPGDIPGMGEQPSVDIRFDAMPERVGTSRIEPSSEIQQGGAEVIAATAAHLPAAETPTEAPPLTREQPIPAAARADAPTQEPSGEAIPEPSAHVATPKLEIVADDAAQKPAAPAPEPEAKPRPQRTGPARKGWWQRSLG